jgi:hypothetical protein
MRKKQNRRRVVHKRPRRPLEISTPDDDEREIVIGPPDDKAQARHA